MLNIKSLTRRFIPFQPWPWFRLLLNLRIVRGPITSNQDGITTMHCCGVMKEPRFVEAYSLGKKWLFGDLKHTLACIFCFLSRISSQISRRRFCGTRVNRGRSALMAMNYVDFVNNLKWYYLLDTFKGLDNRYVIFQQVELGSPISFCQEYHEDVMRIFDNYRKVEIIRASISDTLPLLKANDVGYLHN